ncbi:hypothetical protein [Streptomyces griseoluteus]
MTTVHVAQRINRKHRTRRQQQGITGLVAGPTVAHHLNTCIRAGWTRLEIAAATGVSERAIRYILNGQRTVQHHNASRLLAIRPEDSPRVPATGVIRRIKALSRAGYPIDWTGQQIGCSHRHIYEILNGTVELVDRRFAERLAELYRRREATPGPSRPARIAAKARGWDGPEAWDVDTIDDPDAEPNYGQTLNFHERAQLRREEIEHLAWCGHTPEQIRARLDDEVSISTIRQIVQEWRTGQKRVRTNRERTAA